MILVASDSCLAWFPATRQQVRVDQWCCDPSIVGMKCLNLLLVVFGQPWAIMEAVASPLPQIRKLRQPLLFRFRRWSVQHASQVATGPHNKARRSSFCVRADMKGLTWGLHPSSTRSQPDPGCIYRGLGQSQMWKSWLVRPRHRIQLGRLRTQCPSRLSATRIRLGRRRIR